jgi:predicted PurR-regulated permease PerM
VPESRGVPKVQLAEPSFRANDYLWMGSVGLIALLSQMVLVLFLVFFLLASGDLYKRKIVKLAGNTLAAKRVTVEAINEINLQIERFLLTQVAVGILVGVCTTAALWGFGLNEPVFWGLASGLVNSVPYFGGIVVTGALAIVAFLQFDSLWMAAAVSGSALAITSLEGFLLTPALLGRATRINGVAMFLSLLFWSWVWGVIGMIVAVPIMIVIKCVCDRIEGLMPIGELLGERDSGAATRSSS